MQDTLYFSNMVGRTVQDSAGHSLGAVSDLVVVSGDLFPRITGLVISSKRQSPRLFIATEQLQDLSAAPMRLKTNSPGPLPLHLEEGEARLGHAFLDKQIVDTHGARVVRINDLKLARIDSDLRLLGADVGFAGLLRRLRMEGAAQRLAWPFSRRLEDSVIPWNVVDPLSSDRVRLNVTRGRLREMRAPDLADILEQLSASQRSDALASLSDEQLAETLSETRPDVQRAIIEELEDERASDILERMAPDDATDLLQDLHEERREDLLERMEPEERDEITELLQYPQDTAGGLMTPEMVVIPAGLTAEGAIAHIRSLAPDTETVYYLYIVDENHRLEGVVSLRALITAPADAPVRSLANTRVHTVNVGNDQEHVAELMSRYNLLALPVVDDAGSLKGIVTIDDVIDVLREEASEDIAAMSGHGEPGTQGAPALFSTARLGWLLLVLTAAVVVAWGTLLALRGPAATAAAFFVPLMMEGSCSLALQASRAVSSELSDSAASRLPGAVLEAELLAGTVLALLLGLLTFGSCLLWPQLPGSARLALPLGVCAASLFGVLCGAALPLALIRLREDPTSGLRPLLLSLTSAGSLALYLGIFHAMTG